MLAGVQSISKSSHASGPNGKYYEKSHPYFFNQSCPSAMGLLPFSIGGEQWDDYSQTPFLQYTDPQTGELNEVWYENARSLSLKYACEYSNLCTYRTCTCLALSMQL